MRECNKNGGAERGWSMGCRWCKRSKGRHLQDGERSLGENCPHFRRLTINCLSACVTERARERQIHRLTVGWHAKHISTLYSCLSFFHFLWQRENSVWCSTSSLPQALWIPYWETCIQYGRMCLRVYALYLTSYAFAYLTVTIKAAACHLSAQRLSAADAHVLVV